MTPLGPAAIIGILCATLVIGFWGMMFYDMATNSDLPAGTKNVWALAFIFLSLFAAPYYYANVYRFRHHK